MQKRRRSTGEGFSQETSRRRERGFSLKHGLIIAAGVLAVCVLVVGLWFASLVYWQEPDTSDPVVFEVTQGSNVNDIVEGLVDQELIEHPNVFHGYLRISNQARRLQAGRFTLQPGMSYQSLANALTSADVFEVSVTIPEGYTAKQIGERVRESLPHIETSQWEEVIGPDSMLKEEMAVFSNLPADAGLEGYLFPDTYRFRADTDAQSVAQKMAETFVQRFGELDVDVSQGVSPVENLSLHEFVTLASIIEREVQSPEDMQNVADIFLKRLESGMMLQADSTVNYVIDGDNPSLTLEQTELDSPYNTYKYTGLPPGPISNPGSNALNAVLDPTPNTWYFFLTTPDGEVKYAETFSQHTQNKNEYLD